MKLYLDNFVRFRVWYNETHAVNINSDQDLILTFKPKKEVEMNELLKDYLTYLGNKKLSKNSINNIFFGLNKILKINKIKCQWENLRENYIPAHREIVSDRIPTKTELESIFYSKIGLRDKIMVLLGLCGFRARTLVSLRLYELNLDFGNDYGDEYKGLGLITVRKYDRNGNLYIGRKMKTLNEYHVILSRECVQYLKRYLEYRKRKHEDITDNSPILTSNYKGFEGKLLENGFATKQWRKILNRLGFNDVAFDQNNIKRYSLHFHSLRKYFKSMCANVGMSKDHISYLMGQATGLDKSYERFVGNEINYLKDFLKVEPFITIASERPRVNHLESDIAKMKETIKALSEMLKGRYEDANGIHEFDVRPKILKEAIERESSKPTIVKIRKDDVDRYMELRQMGYVKTMENHTFVVLEKQEST